MFYTIKQKINANRKRKLKTGRQVGAAVLINKRKKFLFKYLT